MKKIINLIYNRPILILIITLIILFVPMMFTMQPQSQIKLIVRTLGIDKVEDQIEVSLVCYQPSTSQAYTESYNLISAKGDSLTEALDLAADYMGKQVVLGHVSDVAVSQQVAEENLAEYINHLVRSFTLNNSTNVFITNISAKDFLKETLKTHGKTASQESGLIEHNDKYLVGNVSNVEKILVSVFAPFKTTFIDILSINSDEGEDLSGESQSSGSSNSDGSSEGGGQSGGQQEPKYLSNDGKVAIIYEGKMVGELNRNEVEAINAINSEVVWPKLTIKNFTDEDFDNATIVFNIPNKEISFQAYFDNGQPTIVANIKMLVKIFESLQSKQTSEIYAQKNILVTKAMQQAIAEKVKTEFYPAFEKLQNLKADPFEFYTLFHTKYQKEFDEFLNSLQNKQDYMKYIKIILQVDCQGK